MADIPCEVRVHGATEGCLRAQSTRSCGFNTIMIPTRHCCCVSSSVSVSENQRVKPKSSRPDRCVAILAHAKFPSNRPFPLDAHGRRRSFGVPGANCKIPPSVPSPTLSLRKGRTNPHCDPSKRLGFMKILLMIPLSLRERVG